MPTDAEFLAAIAMNPHDDITRLIYADWLDERNDTRASYLRAEVALHRADAMSAPALRNRFSEARANLDARWIAAMEQPRTLRVNPTPYPAAWWGIGLAPYRRVDGTYNLYPYESTPDVPLNLVTTPAGYLHRPEDPPRTPEEHLNRLQESSGYRFPKSMMDLVTSQPAMERLRSCTACYFKFGNLLSTVPEVENTRFYLFYVDDQTCLSWYLYLHPSGDHCIVTSGASLGEDEASDREELGLASATNEPQANEADRRNPPKFWFCAPNFEVFIARWWLENEVFFHLFDSEYGTPIPLTPEQQAYIAHYQATNPQNSG